jgi:hypothetical protein
MIPDRRKVSRRFLSHTIRVFNKASGQQIGNLVDITTGGVLIVSPKPMTKNRIVHMRLELTTELSHKPFLEFTTRCKWCREDIDPRFYKIGFQITKLPPEGAEIIQIIIEMLGFNEKGLWLGGQKTS